MKSKKIMLSSKLSSSSCLHRSQETSMRMLARLETSGLLIKIPARLSNVLSEELENKLKQSFSRRLDISKSLINLLIIPRLRVEELIGPDTSRHRVQSYLKHRRKPSVPLHQSLVLVLLL